MTLIELLTVVIIIGLLAAVALPRFTGAREKAHRSQMLTSLRTLVSAQEAYFEEFFAYASDVSALEFNETPVVNVQILETAGNGWSAKTTHNNTSIECGVYIGPVTPPAGITFDGEGIVTCNG